MSDFLYAKFDGSRFDTHMLPYELLPDIHAYAVLIERLAQHLYRSNNNRRRIPKEFKEKFNLRIGKFQEGSTIAPLVRELPPGYGEDEANTDEYSIAKNMVNNVLKAMEQGQPIPNDFPTDILPLFNNFGKNLHSGESIYFSPRNNFPANQTFKYDKNVRLTLITTGKSDYKDSCNILGKLDGLEVLERKVKLIVSDNIKIPVSFNDSFTSSIRNLHHELEKYDVRIFGLASYRKDDTISAVDDVQHITIYEGATVTSAPSIPSRIDDIKNLQDGWYQTPDVGDAFDGSKLDLIQSALESLIQDEQPAPFIYPTPDNEISCEWNIGTWDISATFDFTENKVFLHSLNHSNNETRSRETDIGDLTQLTTTLSEFLSEFLPKVDDE